jgi:hypothetical protein
VLALMRQDNLLALRSKPFVPRTTDSSHAFPIAPNLIRDLVPTGLDQIWVADITPAFAGAGSMCVCSRTSSFSPSSSTLSHAWWWAGPWRIICAPNSPSPPSTPAFAGAGYGAGAAKAQAR